MPLPELEELYTLYRTDLYRYLCHLTHDPTEAEDILSETFLRAMRRLPTYRGDCAVKTWLFGIARNIWLESLRKRRPDVSADDLLENYLAEDTLTEHTDTRRNGSASANCCSRKTTAPAALCSCARRAIPMRKSRYSCISVKARPASSNTAPAAG